MCQRYLRRGYDRKYEGQHQWDYVECGWPNDGAQNPGLRYWPEPPDPLDNSATWSELNEAIKVFPAVHIRVTCARRRGKKMRWTLDTRPIERGSVDEQLELGKMYTALEKKKRKPMTVDLLKVSLLPVLRSRRALTWKTMLRYPRTQKVTCSRTLSLILVVSGIVFM